MSLPNHLAHAQAHLGRTDLFTAIRESRNSEMFIKINSLGNPEPVEKNRGVYRCGQKKENEIVRDLASRSIERDFSDDVSERTINEYKDKFNALIYNGDNAQRYPCELIDKYIGRAEKFNKDKKELLELKKLHLSALGNLKNCFLRLPNRPEPDFIQGCNSLTKLLTQGLITLTESQVKALEKSQAKGLTTSQMKALAESQKKELEEEVKKGENAVKQLLFDFDSGASCVLIIDSLTSVEPALRHLANTNPDINGKNFPSLNNDIEEDLGKLTTLKWERVGPFQDGHLQKFLQTTTPENPIIAEVRWNDEQSLHWVVIVGSSSPGVCTVLDPIHGRQSITIHNSGPSEPQEYNLAEIAKAGQFTGNLIRVSIQQAPNSTESGKAATREES